VFIFVELAGEDKTVVLFLFTV